MFSELLWVDFIWIPGPRSCFPLGPGHLYTVGPPQNAALSGALEQQKFSLLTSKEKYSRKEAKVPNLWRASTRDYRIVLDPAACAPGC